MSSDYSEEKNRILETELDNKKALLKKYTDRIEELESDLKFRTEYLTKKVDDITASYKKASSDYLEIKNSSSWRMTSGIRKTIAYFRDFLKNHVKFRIFLQLLKIFLTQGPKSSFLKLSEYKEELLFSNLKGLGFDVTEDELETQTKTQFSRNVRISIISFLCNPSYELLKSMIKSVEAQTYSCWEVCFSDVSDDQHGYVQRICEQYSKKDSRFKYRKLEKDLDISQGLNICIEMATGEFIALLDQNDVLHPCALFEVVKAICEDSADFIYTDEIAFHNTPRDAYAPHYKPDFAPDTLCGSNYICHLAVFKRTLIEATDAFDPKYVGAQDYDLFLRLSEKAENIVHIPRILYYKRALVRDSSVIKANALEAGKRAIEAHIERQGYTGNVTALSSDPAIYKIQYEIYGNPKVSILIPNCDHLDDLKKCIDSIISKTSYKNYEIVIIENNSNSKTVFDYYEQLKKDYCNIRIITWNGQFNYSAINNFGTKNCSGDYYLFLNNDTEVISSEWIEQMLMYAQREDVGAVGAKLYYPDNTIQHAGIGLGLFDLAGPFFRNVDRNDDGYLGRLLYSQNVSAVTAACMMVPRVVWENLSGFDESFEVAFNDVDLCLRIRKAGWLIVWTPFAELYHYESKSRGMEDTAEKRIRFENEYFRFKRLWAKELAEGDPYYNPNFTMKRADFTQ